MRLSDDKIYSIRDYLAFHGVFDKSLLDDLTDHLACKTEEEMEKGTDFDRAIKSAKESLFPKGPFAVQHELFLENIKRYVFMRKFQFILGYIATTIFLVGYSFKMLHWPTASVQLLIGSSLFAWIFLPIYWTNRRQLDLIKRNEKSISYYVINGGLAILTASSMPFIFMHWPYHNQLMLLSVLIMAFYFMPRIFMNLYKNNLKEAKTGL